MTLGPLMVGIAGTGLSAPEREMLQHPLVGGVILFARNCEGPEQLSRLLAEVHGLREPRLLVAVDQEGGRVQRLKAGFTELPALRGLGMVYDQDPHSARSLAGWAGWLTAAEIRAVGVDFSFTPVLDLDRGVSAVIGDRALHADPEAVARLGHAYVQGLKAAGAAAVGKHFPGHGGVAADSHHCLPVDERAYTSLHQQDIRPFERLIHEGLPALMMAHVVYPRVDERIASLSPVWIREMLRRRHRFQGVVFSDDLGMAALDGQGGMVERVSAALDAGCDMAVVGNELETIPAVLDGLTRWPDPVAHSRLLRLHGRPGPSLAELHATAQWHQAVEATQRYVTGSNLSLNLP